MNDKNISKRIISSVTMAAAIAAGTASNVVQVFASDTGDPVDDPNAALQQATQTVESARQEMDDASAMLSETNAEVTHLSSEKEAEDQKLADANAQLKQAQDEYDSLKDKTDFITDEDRANAENTVTEATKAADDA